MNLQTDKLVKETSEKRLLELITPIPKNDHTTNTHYQNGFFSKNKHRTSFGEIKESEQPS